LISSNILSLCCLKGRLESCRGPHCIHMSLIFQYCYFMIDVLSFKQPCLVLTFSCFLFFQVLKPLQDKFKNIICQENFNRMFHLENIKLDIIDILESFIGKIMLLCMLHYQC
jgi:hypothetical protein